MNSSGRKHKYLLIGALLAGMLPANASRAEVLPWLSHIVNDPFSAEKKATRMIDGNLRPACPGPPDVSRPLHFNDVVIASLCNNPDAKSAYLTLLGQASTYVSNYSAYLPNVSANINNSRSTSFTTNQATTVTTLSNGAIVTGAGGFGKFTDISHSYGISAGLTLYDFGQREFRLDIAEKALIAAGYSYNSSLQGMIASALQGYFQLLTAQNGVSVARESEEYAKESYDAAALRHHIGLVPLADELQAKGAYSQAQLATDQALDQLSQAKTALALLMGMPADTQVQVAEMGNESLTRDPFNVSVQTLMEQAKQKRNDLLAAREQLEGSQESLEALKRSDLATLSVTTNVSQGNNTISIFHGVGATRTQSIGLSVSIPIFTGWSQTYNEQATEEQLEAQEDTLQKTELGVEQDVWNSWHSYEIAKQSWDTSKDLLASSRQLKDVALGRYKEGLGTILDVLNAQSQYNSALQSQLQTRYNLLTARVNLVRAAGVLDLDTMQPGNVTDIPTNLNPPSNPKRQ